ncbi:DNA topoisomerase 3 [Thiobaca trueperi]|uniref:DNA topoisomerase n=1 Tax=Thiobaca trueperi TaxID=127458 RepID=A0A4R3N0E8_9GAMM|nr:DNA topoisomerase 3 [Thiobaca trueperi]TCT22174.1 DNA topoisomerase-3 [Thiobaca trueperi]
MTTVVLAEKPSVARDIARVLGAARKGEGCLEGNGYRVTWALGHLIHFAEPDDYGEDWARRWSLDPLPMVPERWKLQVGERTASQFRLVKALINAPETERIVCATDAGREGEHIFRLIYEQARCNKPVERLWISSLTDEAIREGFRTLKPGQTFDHLAQAARARAQADWLVGMNLTRAYTVHNRVLCTIGRVQTPTLAMIVARDAEIAGFTKAFFYELVAHLAEGFEARYLLDGATRIERKETAERLHRALSPHPTGIVRKVDKRIRQNRPPPLYDLTSLQRDANRRFGFTAAQVLEQAQTLYETHKLISYPRTESRHLSEDMLPRLPGILRNLEHPLAAEALKRLEAGHRLSKAYVDRTKLTDHHAILPTGKIPPADLPGPLRKIHDLVAARFVAIFLPDQRLEETRVEIAIGEGLFLARGSVVLDPGWKRVDAKEAGPDRPRSGRQKDAAAESDDSEPPGSLPPLEPGQTVHVDRLEVREKETQPPRHYDDASLLAAMKNAGRTIEDDALASAMAASGLGTPATRAETIEKLIRTGYLERQRKQILATEKGRALIGLVAAPLRSPELTAEWEQRLKDVERGEGDVAGFYRDIVAFVRDLIPCIAQGPALSPEQVEAARQGEPKRRGGKGAARAGAVQSAGLGKCPLCKTGEITENTRAFGCSRYRDGCGFTIWKTVAGLSLTKPQVRQLIEQGRTDVIEGFCSKAGKPFTAALRLDATGKVVFDFSTASSEPVSASRTGIREQPPRCPKCGQGQIIEGRRGYGCNRYREGCDFVVWKSAGGLILNEGQIRELIEQGHTGPVDGLAGDDGEPRRAVRLHLDEQWRVVFE